MPLPEIDEKNRNRPLCYDSARKKFILFDEIVAGEEQIISVDDLSGEDLKRLVIQRWRELPPDTVIRNMSGPPYTRDDVIRAIEQDQPFGRETVEMEKGYLRYFLAEIKQNLP